MISARASVLIARPREEVFSFITDPANDRLWRSHLTASRGTVAGTGDRVTQTYSFGGRSATIELEVSEYAPPERFALRLSNPYRARFAFQCLAESGGTRVGMSFSADPGGVAQLAEGRIVAEAERLARTDLTRLRNVLESR
ncbi:MAG: SRPBCC family protein [Aeromicrobium sp.]|jgi:uncharacterized protein YndB with AHSA1/START domain|nr:SRPBCC family protein [Aeromicrobium sp.]